MSIRTSTDKQINRLEKSFEKMDDGQRKKKKRQKKMKEKLKTIRAPMSFGFPVMSNEIRMKPETLSPTLTHLV
ncbi:hypothetical protein RUM43_003555 [Polyplax serrata]|uniref:Uncharacterized protein n=1 Tax=Polyplax serrata TaxID=468196 RepID=A0AAN8S5L7_POLSC